MSVRMHKNELKVAVKESVREVFAEELMRVRALLLPFASVREQKDIERRYGAPLRKAAKTVEIKI